MLAPPNRACLTGLLLLVAANAAWAETIDRVLALVGGEVITLSDVTAASELGLVTIGNATDPTGFVLLRLIDRRLVLIEVDRYAPPEPAAEAVDREAQRVRATFSSGLAYEATLARSGIDEKHLRELLRDELRIRAYLDQRFAVPPPNDEDLGRYYREHLQTFTRGGQVLPLDTARAEITRALTVDRRQMLVDEWVAGLRRRADITNLYLPGR